MVTVLSVGFVSCSDDDDDEPDFSTSIVGTWEEAYGKYDWNFGDGKEQEESALSDFFFVFESDGTWYDYETGDNITESKQKYSGKWSIKGNVLTRTTNENETYTETIVELTSTKLVIDWYEDLGNGQYDHSIVTFTRRK